MSGRTWGLIRATALALTVVAVAPVSPLVLVAVPLAVQLLAFRARDGVAVVLAAILLLFVFRDVAGAGDPMWYAERGWALLVGGGFAAATVVWPERSLVTRGLAAVVTAFAVVVATALARPGLVSELDWWLSQEMTRAARTAFGLLAGSGSGEASSALGATWDAFSRVVDWQVLLYPGFLTLATLAALAVAWFVVVRLSGEEDGLRPLREFRFDDHLVWLVIAGLAVLLLPLGEWVHRVGGNVLLVMGGLYLLRGIGVVFWVGASAVTSAWSLVLWAVVGVLLYPVALVVMLLLGLGDTWWDLRGRLARLVSRGGRG